MRKEFEKLPEIRKIMNENGIYFMNHSGWYEARDFKDFEYEQYINGAWYSWQARVPEGYVVVPVEINDEIESAMFSSVARGEMPCDIYKAMIGATNETII